MSRYPAPRSCLVFLVCFLAFCAIAFARHTRSISGSLAITVEHEVLPANSFATTELRVRDSKGRALSDVTWRFVNGRNLTELDNSGSPSHLRAGVTPGMVTLAALAPGFRGATTEVRLGLDPSDEFGDGTPDFIRLRGEEDQTAFRWFGFLAESVYFHFRHS